MKIIRAFIDPMFDTNKTKPTQEKKQKPVISKEPTLGEYVEYEEIK